MNNVRLKIESTVALPVTLAMGFVVNLNARSVIYSDPNLDMHSSEINSAIYFAISAIDEVIGFDRHGGHGW